MISTAARDESRRSPRSGPGADSEHTPERILIVGGDSVGAFTHRANLRGRALVRHFSGRKRRDLHRPIPRQTEAVIVVLDRVSHALARKIRAEATRRGVPVFYQKRAHAGRSTDKSADLALLRAARHRYHPG